MLLPLCLAPSHLSGSSCTAGLRLVLLCFLCGCCVGKLGMNKVTKYDTASSVASLIPFWFRGQNPTARYQVVRLDAVDSCSEPSSFLVIC